MAEISRKELKQLINIKQFDTLYLIYGEEKMYVRADTDLLITKLMGKQPPEFNYHSFNKDYDLDKIAVAVQVVPFMSEYNCVKIADFNADDVSKGELERFFAILDNAPDTTVVVLTMPTLELDAKKPGAFAQILKYAKKKGTVCEIKRETDISLARQIVKWADSRGIKIEQADAYKLIEYTGADLNTVKNELDKLCNYVGDGGLITTRHIEELVTKRLEANIYSLTDAIVSGNGTKAFEILDVLLYQKADPNEIVGVIGMSYTDFYRARVSAECSVPLSETAKYFGYGRREFALKRASGKIRNISTDVLRECVDEITDTTEKLRSVSGNRRVYLEKLVAKLLMLCSGSIR